MRPIRVLVAKPGLDGHDRGGDDFRAAVMAVEARPGYENSNWAPRRQKLVGLAGDNQHLARPAQQRTIAQPVVRRLDDQSRVGAELGEPSRRVQADAMVA